MLRLWAPPLVPVKFASEIAQVANKVVSIMTRIPYVVQRYLPTKSSSSDSSNGQYLPIDMVLYQRAVIVVTVATNLWPSLSQSQQHCIFPFHRLRTFPSRYLL